MPSGQLGFKARRYAPRPCAHCGAMFTPRSGNAKNCGGCGDVRHRSGLLPLPPARVKPVRRVIMRPDFLQALPALKAELARQCTTDHRCHFYLEPSDLTNFGPMRRREE